MKKKLIIVLLLTLILSMSICMSGVAFADSSQSNEDLSYVEENYYINEFNNFLEDIGKDRLSAECIKNKLLYDFSDNPIFILTYTQNSGYMISNRETGTSFERSCVGSNPFANYNNEKCYYMGMGNYYYLDRDNIVNIFTQEIVLDEMKSVLQYNVNKLVNLDKEENGELNLYARTSTSDRLNNSKYISSNGEKYFNRKYDTLIPFNNYQYDRFFPKNDGDSCGIVAAIQLLQYLDRMNKVDTTSVFRKENYLLVKYNKDDSLFPGYCLTQCMHDELDSMTWSGAFGENYTNNIITGLKKFFDKYQPTIDFFGLTCKAEFTFFDNACYDNIKAQIDSGKPAIGMTTTGNGYFSYDSNSDSWEKENVSLHMMIIYGYCTTSSGMIQDFITHSGWRYAGTEKMYVYKLNFIRNITFNYKVGAVVK